MSEGQRAIVRASARGLRIDTTEHANDLIGECFGAEGCLLTMGELGEAFFELRTGVAGELLQKAANYRLRLAIVVDDVSAHGPRFEELAREHRRHATTRFFTEEREAMAWLEREP